MTLISFNYLFIYLFIYDVFNDPLNSADFIAVSIAKHVEPIRVQ